MIIDISKCGYDEGYVPKVGTGAFHPFFATANAAFRKDALLKIGGFDTACATGEDVDVSIRLAKAGYELWFEPKATILHLHRSTLRELLRQWYHYGFGHPYLFRKHHPRPRLEFYRYDLSDQNRHPFGVGCFLSISFPIYTMIFFSAFHFMHLMVFCALIFLLAGWTSIAFVSALSSILAFAYYLLIRFDFRRPVRSLQLSALRYITDWSYVLGAFVGGLRCGVIYLEATRSGRWSGFKRRRGDRTPT